MDIYSYKFNTKYGEMKIYFNDEALVYVKLPGDLSSEPAPYLTRNFEQIIEVSEDKGGYSKEINLFLEGKLKKFSLPIYFKGTEFQEKVWKELLNIPYGETRTYKELAERVNCMKGYRAVGGALNENPLAIIIPCHRVIGSDGKLTGFAGGVDLKGKLLQLEQSNMASV